MLYWTGDSQAKLAIFCAAVLLNTSVGIQFMYLCTGAVPILSADIGRPAKLSFTPALIQEAVNALQCMSRVYRLYNDRDRKESNPSDVDTAQQTIRQWGPSLEMRFTATQVLVEFQLLAKQATDFNSPVQLELDSSQRGEGSAPNTTTEGLMIAWDNLTATYPHHENTQG